MNNKNYRKKKTLIHLGLEQQKQPHPPPRQAQASQKHPEQSIPAKLFVPLFIFS